MDEGGGTRYRRCGSCGTVFASPRSPASERFAWLDRSFGLGDLARDNEVARAPALKVEAGILKRHVPAGRMLDVGCGLGLLFTWFASEEWQRHGVEISPTAAEFAARKWRADVAVGSLRTARFPSEHFDLVTMIDMIYYVDDPRADIREAVRILRPGAVLGIEIAGQAYQFLRSRGPVCWLLDGKWTRLRSDSSYLWWFSPRGLLRLLEEVGLEVTESRVVRSPRTRSRLRNFLVWLHETVFSALVPLSSGARTWAPKYLVMARKPLS
jgi:SAM-dependent methyltransferase